MNKLAIVAKMLDEAIDELNAVIDPYAHLKEAHDKGEMVQHQSEKGKWHNCIHSSGWAYNDEPDRYRIKPKKEEVFDGGFILSENSGAWVGKINGQDVSFVANRESQNMYVSDKLLTHDEIEQLSQPPYKFKYNFDGTGDTISKPKTKTLYLFAYRDENTKSWKNTDIYHESIIDARADILWAVEFKRLDYTAIEVES